LAIILACVVWGLSSIHYKALAHVPPEEVLSHRTLWSLVFFAGILVVTGRAGSLWALVTGPQRGKVALAALMISINWYFFIFSVQTGRALGASLGYYIFPLVAVLLGVIFFRERLGPFRIAAVALAAVAVTILTVGLGQPPWISLLLAFTFGLYGVVKKGLAASAVTSVAGEVLLLAPVAMIWLVGIYAFGWGGITGRVVGAFGANAHDTIMLAFAGVITGLPLVLFSYGAQWLNLGLVGILNYLNPTLQFLVATFLFLEPVTRWHMIALPIIWIALGLYSVSLLRHDKAPSNRVAIAGTSGTTVTKSRSDASAKP
jgi:chloramphenicol-sensitive protein RarD